MLRTWPRIELSGQGATDLPPGCQTNRQLQVHETSLHSQEILENVCFKPQYEKLCLPTPLHNWSRRTRLFHQQILIILWANYPWKHKQISKSDKTWTPRLPLLLSASQYSQFLRSWGLLLCKCTWCVFALCTFTHLDGSCPPSCPSWPSSQGCAPPHPYGALQSFSQTRGFRLCSRTSPFPPKHRLLQAGTDPLLLEPANLLQERGVSLPKFSLITMLMYWTSPGISCLAAYAVLLLGLCLLSFSTETLLILPASSNPTVF